jgi:hypothetical protein
MKSTFILLILFNVSLISYSQIIANHSIVADFDKIPSYYINEVKKMMVCFLGESHSEAYITGMELLEASYPEYSCNVSIGESYTDQYLRINYGNWTGEDVWYTWNAYPDGSRPSTSNTIKNLIKEYSDHNHPLNVIGFAWCWDMLGGTISNTIDPTFGCHWFGSSVGSPEGNISWGLDAADYTITGNSVSMDTYLNANQDYTAYCTANGYNTRVVFTTGPVDDFLGESGYQGHLKHEYIRNFVAINTSRILFDYADILCYDNNGTQSTTTWNGHTFPIITTSNRGDGSIGHIGSAGAIRLAKAQWWMLARIAGWDGFSSIIPVTKITVSGAAGATAITTDNGTLQLSAAVLPANASNKTVTWSIADGTGKASINASGLVTAIENGTVTARATANDASGVYGTLSIDISGQTGVVTSNEYGEKNESFLINVNRNELKIITYGDYISWNARLYNIQGSLVQNRLVDRDIITFDVSALPSGFYIVIFSKGENSKIVKVIIP